MHARLLGHSVFGRSTGRLEAEKLQSSKLCSRPSGQQPAGRKPESVNEALEWNEISVLVGHEPAHWLIGSLRCETTSLPRNLWIQLLSTEALYPRRQDNSAKPLRKPENSYGRVKKAILHIKNSGNPRLLRILPNPNSVMDMLIANIC